MHTTQRKYPALENNRFANYPGEPVHSFFWQSVYMYLLSVKNRTHASVLEQQRLKAFTQATYGDVSGSVRATWIGHASFLIEIGEFSVLTDPVFGDLSFLFKRIQRPGLLLEQLPTIDAVVISHNHRDHLDEHSIRALVQLYPSCHFYVPMGDAAWFLKRGITRVTECMWWDTCTITHANTQLTLQFLPAHHWSQRGLFDRNKSLWGSWLLQTNQSRVYFAGDTAYSSHFKQIAHEVGPIDLALMPIAPCEPNKWMKFSHMNAEEAGKAFLDLQARACIPMHWGTFYFGTDTLFGPLDRFTSWWQAHAPAGQLYTPSWGIPVALEAPSLVHSAVEKKLSTIHL